MPRPRLSRAARGLLAALVGLALLLAAIVVGAVPAAAQSGVGASSPAMINIVGVSTDIGAGQRLGTTVLQPQIVVATGVAAETAAGVGARDAAIEATTEGQRFVRIGAGPRNLKWTFEHPGGTAPGTYAVPEDYFNSISHDPAYLKDVFDLPDTSLPQVYRVLEPPAGTPIQYGTVPGGEFGGVGGAPEVFFPKGY